jgi:hypothetical protein
LLLFFSVKVKIDLKHELNIPALSSNLGTD